MISKQENALLHNPGKIVFFSKLSLFPEKIKNKRSLQIPSLGYGEKKAFKFKEIL